MVSPDRGAGVLLGLACGDALGRPVEGMSADRIAAEYGRLTEMRGRGVHRLPAGTLTDDTDMALCLGRSLVERGAFDPADVADRFLDWYESGPVGVGGMTRRVMERLRRGEPWDEAGRREWERSPEGQNAGNGSTMRCAPLAVAFADDRDVLARTSRDSSRITHADPRCTHGCAVLNDVVAGCLTDASDSLATALASLPDDAPAELVDALDPVPALDAAALRPTGYVVDALQAALTVALAADSAEAAVVEAVNLGGDTDTVGAMVGAVAGARFGADALPDRWLDPLDRSDELRDLGETLATGEFEG